MKNILLILTAICFTESLSAQAPKKSKYPVGTVHCKGIPTAVVNVRNPVTGKVWMDCNLGASRAAISSTDELAYGDLYQWGRRADGHQCRNSKKTRTLSSSDKPLHGYFIKGIYDWRSPQNDLLWQGEIGINNPCPLGYRVPTSAELNSEMESLGSGDDLGAFESPLKLPLASLRYNGDGSLYGVGSYAYYWSSTVNGIAASYLYFSSGIAYIGSNYRALGFSVRCIKD